MNVVVSGVRNYTTIIPSYPCTVLYCASEISIYAVVHVAGPSCVGGGEVAGSGAVEAGTKCCMPGRIANTN
jgi:hypothetical protein